MHLVLGLGRLPPLPLGLGPARGVGVSLDFRLLCASALPLLHLFRELAKRDLLVRSGLPLLAPLPRLSLTIPRRTFDDVRNRERLRSLTPACYPPVVPDLRIEEHGRIRELDRGRVAPVDVAVVLGLSPLPVRSQEVESVDVGHRPGRSLLVFGHGLLTATALGVEALVLGEIGLNPQIDTGLAGTALGVTGRGLLTATDHVVSVLVPLPAGEVGVTGRGHPISRVALMTASGHAIDNLPLLTVRGQVRKDGWPNEISRRVVRRLSLRLVLYLKCRLELLPLWEGLLYRHFRLLFRILPGSF